MTVITDRVRVTGDIWVNPNRGYVWWAFKQTGVTSTQKFLLVTLAHHLDEGHPHPTYTRLARETNNSKQTVIRNIKQLEAAGFITITWRDHVGGGRSPEHYRLNCH